MNKGSSKNMSLIIGIIALIMGLHTAFAQGNATVLSPQEIMFESGIWKDITDKAKNSGRYIFVDAYTSWCVPCRQLKKVTFKDENAAAYYTENFINYTVDMEKDEGLALADKWDVTAYPALLYFTPEGKMVMKQIGYVDGKGLVELGKEALTRK